MASAIDLTGAKPYRPLDPRRPPVRVETMPFSAAAGAARRPARRLWLRIRGYADTAATRPAAHVALAGGFIPTISGTTAHPDDT